MRLLFVVFLAAACPAPPADPTAAPPADPTAAPPADPTAAPAPADPHAGHQGHAAAGMEYAALPTAKVSFVQPTDGAVLSNPIKMVFAVEGASVQPAGSLVAGTGHHHVIVNGAPTPEGTAVPADDTHIHYGKGQTEAEITLPPGKHTLTLQFADGMHRSYGPTASQTISIAVQ
jgi:hypothetical protein